MFKYALIWVYLYNGSPAMLVYSEYPGLQKCTNEIADATAEFQQYNRYGYMLLKTECVPLS